MIIKCVAHSLNLALLTQKAKREKSRDSVGGRETERERRREAAKRNDTDINFPHEKAAVTIYVLPAEEPKKGPTEEEVKGVGGSGGDGGGGEAKPKRKRVNWQI